MMSNISLCIALMLLSGCAVKAEKVPLFSAEYPKIQKCGDALSASLAVAPVNDGRPEHEKTGQKPKGVFLGVWNQRIGEYITSDKDFEGDVPQTITRQILHVVDKSNCFFEMKLLQDPLPVQPSPEELLVAFAKNKARYILATELKHFYGTQYQNSRLAVIPTGIVDVATMNDSVGDAQGFTELSVTLYDAQIGQELMREKVETFSDSPIKGAYPQAAKESLQKAAENVAKAVHKYAQTLA